MDKTKYYKIKTSSGWFFTVSHGRYGRFGSKAEGHVYCKKCAEKIADNFREIDEGEFEIRLDPEIRELESVWRFKCQNEKHNDIQNE
jgi:hypothetical protein